ncbi:hypothetical protein D3C86_2084940 [compost metagenome]
MFRIDEGSLSAYTLNLSDRMQCNRRLTGRFRSVYFDNTASWQSANAERNI